MTMDLTFNLSAEPEVKVKNKEKGKKPSEVHLQGKEVSWGKRKHPENSIPPDKYEKKKRKKSEWSEGSEKKQRNTNESGGVVSSLFARNPEIPEIEASNVKPIAEPVFSSQSFSAVSDLHPHLVANLEQNFGIEKMTEVQVRAIPALLSGSDTLVRSQTGSGKTLAFAVPIMQSLRSVEPKVTRADGVRALVVLPTRELALQTYECFLKLARSSSWLVPGILAGGEKRKSEKARIRRGINILVGTPGRLLDHTQNTKSLNLGRILWLVLDEADMMLDMGYEKDIAKLVEVIEKHREEELHFLNLPKKQTVLLSATLTSAVERLAGLALSKPVHIDVSASEDTQEDTLVVPQSLAQKYIVAPAKLRLVSLAAFILRKCQVDRGSKMIIFMATQDMVDFHTDLLSTVLEKTAEFLKLHGNMNQPERTDVFKTFRASESGVLLCTDVGARGLDLPKVDWIVQYTAPATPADYVHRVGRTARVGTQGSALLFLSPEEVPFIELLSSKRIKLKEESVNYYLESLLLVDFISSNKPKKGFDMESAATELQMSFEQAVIQQKKLHESACNAFKSWVRFYASYPKEAMNIFRFKNIHLGHYAKSFALRDTPSAIGGIGRPKHLKKDKVKKKMHNKPLEDMGRTKKLILSEFDSGLKPLKKVIT